MKDISLYQQVINNLINNNNSTVIVNELTSSKKLVLLELLNTVKENIYILDTDFPKEIFGDKDIQAAFKEAIYKKVSINIAIRNKNPEAEEFFETLKKDKKCKIYTGLNERDDSEILFNKDFYMADNKRFRLETQDNKAYVCFNNPELSEQLKKWFDLSIGK